MMNRINENMNLFTNEYACCQIVFGSMKVSFSCAYLIRLIEFKSIVRFFCVSAMKPFTIYQNRSAAHL